MKGTLLMVFLVALNLNVTRAQVTQINSNKSLVPTYPLTSDKTILVSDIDSTVWVTNGTLAGTIQLSPSIRFGHTQAVLNDKLIFRGTTGATGMELYVTDGTVAGTMLLNDIYPGPAGSIPDLDMAILNGFVYFTAARPAEGRELWRTNGTPAGTTFVKDMVAGPTDSNTPDSFNLFSNGNYLLLAVQTAATGRELWKSDGTAGGTIPIADINPGTASSNPDAFYKFNNVVFFQATDGTRGREYWKTDGTPGGTSILKDINPGMPSAFSPFSIPLFYLFNGKAFFIANDGVHGDEIWSTDGTEGNTTLLKDIQTGAFALTPIFSSVKVGNKFFFTTTNYSDRFELWESDGTPAGTVLFKAFDPEDGAGTPLIYAPYEYDYNTMSYTQPLFQGNKFFFQTGTSTEGVELWISDGTLAGTKIVKNIGSGTDDGLEYGSYVYTSTHLYFAANDGVHGKELWKSDGTEGGTEMVADSNPLGADSDPLLAYFINDGKLFFNANNGDDPNAVDLYVLGGLLPLPIQLLDFTVSPNSSDVLLRWSTTQEINSKDFIVQRSDDGVNFTDVGTIAAAGTSIVKRTYSFTDRGILNNGKSTVYYRLNSRDKDARATISKIVSLNLSGTIQWNARLLNNPVRDQMKVLISGVTNNVQLSVIDMRGKTVYKSLPAKINGQVSIPVNNIKPGMYLLVSESDNERKTIKFVKQ